MFNTSYSNKQAFTLIELLIVVAVIAILSSFILVALKPLQRFEDSRNAKRWSDVNSLLNAIKLNQIDNGGTFYSTIEDMTANTYYQIGDATTGCDTPCYNPSVTLQATCVDLWGLVDDGYIADIPYDPNADGASWATTGYYIYKYDSGQISVGACYEEQGSNSTTQPIEVSR